VATVGQVPSGQASASALKAGVIATKRCLDRRQILAHRHHAPGARVRRDRALCFNFVTAYPLGAPVSALPIRVSQNTCIEPL
jgi:hypothetical protein